MTKESAPKTHRKSHFLHTAEGKEFLKSHFCEKGWSTYQIAESLGTYPNLVRRAMLFHGMKMRSRSDSQKHALESGRIKHPTEGTKRPDDVKRQIGDNLRKAWASIDPDKLSEIKEKCSERWKNMSETDRKNFLSKAAKAVRVTAKEGSKFEKAIYAALITAGFRVTFHKEKFLDYTEMHIDLFLPEEGIAIEIDGPSHFYPVYGEETLLKRIEADNKKNGMLLTEGYIVIRVCDYSRFHSAASLREFNGKLINLIKDIIQNPPVEPKDRLFEINYGKPRLE